VNDSERLDVFNGLLLAPHLDAAFYGGFITVRTSFLERAKARWGARQPGNG